MGGVQCHAEQPGCQLRRTAPRKAESGIVGMGGRVQRVRDLLRSQYNAAELKMAKLRREGTLIRTLAGNDDLSDG